MIAPVRWLVTHSDDQLGTGGWVAYPDEATAEQHAGTAGTVWALVRPEVVRVLEAAQAWRVWLGGDVDLDAKEWDLAAAVDAVGMTSDTVPPVVTPAAPKPVRDRPAGEPLDLDAIRARTEVYRDASGPLDGAAARTAADSAADVPALLAEVVAQRGRISDLETTLAMVGDERAQWNVDLDQLVAERDAALSLVEERDARLEQYRRDLNAFRGMLPTMSLTV
jgi:hypothetical protein